MKLGILSGKLKGTKESPTPPKDKEIKLFNDKDRVDFRKRREVKK